jgi:hypothetical protein
MAYVDDDVAALVIDNGSGMCKARVRRGRRPPGRVPLHRRTTQASGERLLRNIITIKMVLLSFLISRIVYKYFVEMRAIINAHGLYARTHERAYSHAHAHTRTCTHTQTHTHANTHARTHAHPSVDKRQVHNS